jgi:hypothetical protein
MYGLSPGFSGERVSSLDFGAASRQAAPAFFKRRLKMRSQMRARLENVVAYHTAVAEEHARKVADSEEPSSTDEEQRDLHAEVARQLQAVLDADPLVSAIDAAMATRTIRRETQIPRRRVH